MISFIGKRLTNKFNIFYRKNLNSKAFSSHKLNYGQGGNCQINLLKKSYHIQFETIWEDFCIVQIQGNNNNQLVVKEENNKAILNDNHATQNKNDKINIKFKIPEDYTIYGQINGSITHLKSKVSNKLRCNSTNIQLLGKSKLFQWGTFETPTINLRNKEGALDIQNLTFQNGQFECHSFSASKVSFSNKFQVQANHLINIRSVVAFKNAVSKLSAKFVQIQSISGSFDIQAQKVKVQRIWANPGGIKIKAKKIDAISIQTGTGSIEAEEPIPVEAVTLGRMQKSKIHRINDFKINVQ